MLRTHTCGELRLADAGKQATLAGWVQRSRKMGGMTFVDIRDRYGITQLVFNHEADAALCDQANALGREYVIRATGTVAERSNKNPNLETGDIEILVSGLEVLNESKTPPFTIEDNTDGGDDLRMKYRYLDLRRKAVRDNLMLRHRMAFETRRYLDQLGFLEVETPILVGSTPEGARDFVVPSRMNPGEFYALPQSPQLFKQLLMVSGFDRYFQIAKCFRDEDLRADRQPEFTQIDLEMSFIDEEEIMAMNEGFMKKVFEEILNIQIKTPFPRIPYEEAMNRFGSDKPDTRFAMELRDLTPLLHHCQFKVFAGAVQGGGSVRAINVKGAAATLTRKEIDKLTDFVKTYRAKGLAFTRLTAEGESSSYEKFLTENEKVAIRAFLGAETGDVILVVADTNNQVVYDALGALRVELAKRLGLIKKGTFDLLWVTDFPLFEYDEEEGRYVAKHHPFTSPKHEDLHKLESDPGACHARAYDMVLNGCEVGGGSIRINDPEIQTRMFHALGFTDQQAQERFGFLLDAFKYGAPPHGGMAFGLDRLVMLLLEKESIRDVIAFPKVQTATELMTMCPAEVEQKSLDELHIAVTEKE